MTNLIFDFYDFLEMELLNYSQLLLLIMFLIISLLFIQRFSFLSVHNLYAPDDVHTYEKLCALLKRIEIVLN